MRGSQHWSTRSTVCSHFLSEDLAGKSCPVLTPGLFISRHKCSTGTSSNSGYASSRAVPVSRRKCKHIRPMMSWLRTCGRRCSEYPLPSSNNCVGNTSPQSCKRYGTNILWVSFGRQGSHTRTASASPGTLSFTSFLPFSQRLSPGLLWQRHSSGSGHSANYWSTS